VIPWFAAVGVGLWALVAPDAVRADPQATVGLVAGVAGRGQHARVFEEPAFHGGVHGDVLFGRASQTDFGVGPYAEVLTQQFDDLQIGGGASVLFPVLDSFPIVASVGGFMRVADDDFDVQPGVATTLFFGGRSSNYSSPYVMTFGLVAQARVGLDDRRQTSFVLAVQLDTAFLASPVVFLIDALDGGSREVDPVTPTQTAAEDTARPTQVDG
jgi:hypothetical protein